MFILRLVAVVFGLVYLNLIEAIAISFRALQLNRHWRSPIAELTRCRNQLNIF